jgi:hypothetical protein
VERVAIVGTAGSWVQTPWTDPGLKILSLNDAYRLKGFQRADAWYDLHPLDHFVHPTGDRPMFAHEIPPGHYVRPADHLAWLGGQSIPVWLHPDFATQAPQAAAWPHAHAFPKADIEAAFGRYFTSSPAWMLAHVILQGAKEIHVYGIHLATEHEYIEQRPNFEYLLGRVLGPSTVKVTEKDRCRYYETKDGLVVLPDSTPILASNFQYAFQPRPRASVEPLKWELHKYTVKANRALAQLKAAKWYTPTGPIKRDLARWDAYIQDTQEQLARHSIGA